jgi:hypothetical protein
MRDVVILRDVQIDKSGWLGCGPCVVCAYTGKPLSVVEDAFRRMARSDGAATTVDEVEAALWPFGFRLRTVFGFPFGQEPPLWRCLQMLDARHYAESRLAVAVDLADDVRHWVAVCGLKMPLICDALNHGRWVKMLDDGRYTNAPVGAVWAVERR